ncbi:MAG: Bax inhibitor-1/YccA family protein [Bacillus subtilis]|nr:Bax inhibitor-1/YccA family protein [Bacillus subtilis]
MRFFRSTNPVLRTTANAYASDRPVTYVNVSIKTLLLVGVTAAVGLYISTRLESVSIGMFLGSIVLGFIAVIVGTRSVNLAPYAALVYAACEGVLLGFISTLFEAEFTGIVQTAIMTTVIVLAVMMLLHSTNIIKVNQRFTSFLVVALISVIVMSLISLFLPFSGSMYILVSVISAGLAALYLMLDFEAIKTCVESGTDQSYSWVLALGLMVTLVWLYIELLRILAIFANRNR